MFSRVVARVSVRCRLVSQQNGKGVDDNLLSRLLRASDTVGNGGTLCARCRSRTSEVASEPSGAMSGDEKPFRRLPSCVRPYHYDISLTPNLTTFTFDGTENVYLNVSLSATSDLSRCLSPSLSDLPSNRRGKKRVERDLENKAAATHMGNITKKRFPPSHPSFALAARAAGSLRGCV